MKQRIGEEVTEQLEIIPAVLKVIAHVRPKYACNRCDEGVSIASMPKKSHVKPNIHPSNVMRGLEKSKPILEDVRPPKFAQAVGLGFAIVALIGSLVGSSAIFSVAVAFALAAAFLNFAFNYCLGCQFYLLGVRLINH
jgi:hypothetical protein